MHRLMLALFVVIVVGATGVAQPRQADGANEILAIVNGQAITYHEIVGDTDMQAEINAARTIHGAGTEVSDADIERELVFQRLSVFVLNKLLDAEADRVKLNISDSQMRGIINRERKFLGIADDDARGWARYLKERVNLTPTEYRERKRAEIRRNEIMNYMAGMYGALPPTYPLEVYFSLSVSPREIRDEYDRNPERQRIAREVDYRQFKLLYPAELALENKRKLFSAIVEGETSVQERMDKGESLEAASEGIRKLISDLGVPGISLEISPRQVLEDDRTLDATAAQLVLSVSASGGISEVSLVRDTDEDGQQYEGFTFIQLFKRVDGDRRLFKDPRTQEGIQIGLENKRLMQNRAKVEQSLLARAAIVPEKLFTR